MVANLTSFVFVGPRCQPPESKGSVWKGYSWENQLSGGGDTNLPNHRAGQPTSQRLGGKQWEREEYGGVIGADLA